jgi:hypothetical protein
MPEEKKPKRYYYYANERGCMKDPDSSVIDELGIGVDDGLKSCGLKIDLIRFREKDRFTMKVSAHSDTWSVFTLCRDVLDLLARMEVRYPQEMMGTEQFYLLRVDLENLGYKNLGKLNE